MMKCARWIKDISEKKDVAREMSVLTSLFYFLFVIAANFARVGVA